MYVTSTMTTLTTCQIIVQDHLIVQVADFSEINKRVGPNKAMQVGFFLIYIGKNQVLKEKSQKLINVQVLIRPCRKDFFFINVGKNQVLKEKSQKLINVQVLIRLCRCFFPQKIIRFAALLFGRSEYLLLNKWPFEKNSSQQG